MWVSNYSCPIWTFCNRTPVTGYHVIFTSITRALMASLAMFSTVFKTKEKRYGRFRSKTFLEDIFNSEICSRYD